VASASMSLPSSVSGGSARSWTLTCPGWSSACTMAGR
jgi:hypothetical protein